jgi:hypothetical protein
LVNSTKKNERYACKSLTFCYLCSKIYSTNLINFMNAPDHVLLIEVKSVKALELIHQLENLSLISILEENIALRKPKLSEKYRGKLPYAELKGIKELIANEKIHGN